MAESFELSENLSVARTDLGAKIYRPGDGKRPGTPAPGTSYLVLDDDEICHLIVWWWCKNGRETVSDGDMVSRVIELVCDGKISRQTAATMMRALAAQAARGAVNDALLGWAMPELDEYVPTDYPYYSCGNCHKPWPCGCDDPVRICDICGGDQFGCNCDERSYTGES